MKHHTRASQVLPITLSTSKTQFPLGPQEHKEENSEALYEKSPISKKTRREQAPLCNTKMSYASFIHSLNILVSYLSHPYETRIVVHSQESRKSQYCVFSAEKSFTGQKTPLSFQWFNSLPATWSLSLDVISTPQQCRKKQKGRASPITARVCTGDSRQGQSLSEVWFVWKTQGYFNKVIVPPTNNWII